MMLLSPIIWAGFADSLNPGGLAMLLWYGVYLGYISRHNGNVLRAGLWFIVGVFLLRFLFAFGVLDRFLFSPGFDVFLDVTYFIFALWAIIMGALFWRRWGILRREPNDPAVPFLPARVREIRDRMSGRIGLLTGCLCRRKICIGRFSPAPWRSFGLGIFLGLMQTAWVPDAYITSTVAQLPFPENWFEYLKLLSIYSLMFVAVLFFVLAAVVQLRKAAVSLGWLKRSASCVSATLAAVFLAYGLSFLSFYF